MSGKLRLADVGVRILGAVLHGVGYLLAHLLFLRAETPREVVRRLRVAYRLAGVRIAETPRLAGTERTVFLCPYRNLAAGRFGRKWLCHDVLDRVDDGYVTYLSRHRDVDYRRPTGCERLPDCEESAYCYSEVAWE